MMLEVKRNGVRRRGEDGYVMLVVLLLIIMFTSFGILAMRHTQGELRSAGAYLDATQAGDLVEGALALAATDLRVSSDYYHYQFLSAEGASTYKIPLNENLFLDSQCTLDEDEEDLGCIAYLSTPYLYREMYDGEDVDLYGVKVRTSLTHHEPEVGPCPPGFSCFDDQNYGWYTFTVDATASYGSENPNEVASPQFELGRAVGRGRMTVGPISVFGR